MGYLPRTPETAATRAAVGEVTAAVPSSEKKKADFWMMIVLKLNKRRGLKNTISNFRELYGQDDNT